MLLLAIWGAALLLAILAWFPLRSRPFTFAAIASLLVCPNVAYYSEIGYPFAVMPLLTAIPSHVRAFPGGLLLTLYGLPLWCVMWGLLGGIAQRVNDRKGTADNAPADI